MSTTWIKFKKKTEIYQIKNSKSKHDCGMKCFVKHSQCDTTSELMTNQYNVANWNTYKIYTQYASMVCHCMYNISLLASILIHDIIRLSALHSACCPQLPAHQLRLIYIDHILIDALLFTFRAQCCTVAGKILRRQVVVAKINVIFVMIPMNSLIFCVMKSLRM